MITPTPYRLRDTHTVWIGETAIGPVGPLALASGSAWGRSRAWLSQIVDLEGDAEPEEVSADWTSRITREYPTGARVVLHAPGLRGVDPDGAQILVWASSWSSLRQLADTSRAGATTDLAAGALGGMLTLACQSPGRSLTLAASSPSQPLTVTYDPATGAILVELRTDALGSPLSTLAEVAASVSALAAETGLSVTTDAGTELATPASSGRLLTAGPRADLSPSRAALVAASPWPTPSTADALAQWAHHLAHPLAEVLPALCERGTVAIDLHRAARGARYVQIAIAAIWPAETVQEGPALALAGRPHWLTASGVPVAVTVLPGLALDHHRPPTSRPLAAVPAGSGAWTAADLATADPGVYRVATWAAPLDGLSASPVLSLVRHDAHAVDLLWVAVGRSASGAVPAGLSTYASGTISAGVAGVALELDRGASRWDLYLCALGASTGLRLPCSADLQW